MMSGDLDGLRPEDLIEESGSSDDPLVGRVLQGRYEVRALIARGGMGKIFRAEQVPLGRPVALKVLDLGYSADFDPEFRRRFFLEAATSARLAHPNTIRIFDYGHEGDVFFIAMEYIVGRTLLRIIKEEAPLDPLRVVHIGRQMCGSLAEAHGMGVIHRDLKPSNVLITRHGELVDYVKVLDFGLVKLVESDGDEMTKSGLFLGSPNYMSPEQIRAKDVDQRSDIYSLGVILYRALTGQIPFSRSSSMGTLVAQLEDDPPPFSISAPGTLVPRELEAVTMRCLDKDPARRYATVQDLDHALAEAAAAVRRGPPPQEPSLVPSLQGVDLDTAQTDEMPATPEPPEPPARRRRKPRARAARASSRVPLFTGLVLLVLLGVLLVVLGSRLERPTPPDAAPAPAPAPVVYTTIQSAPSGAVVLRGDDFLGTTPLELVIPDGERWSLTLQKVGSMPEAVDVLAGSTLLIELVAEGGATTPAAAPRVAPAAAGARPRPAATPAPPEPTPAPPTRRGSDLRDPWDD